MINNINIMSFARKMNEVVWFEINQHLLLWIANAPGGKKFFETNLPGKMTQIRRDAFTTFDGDFWHVDVFPGNPIGNLIRNKWQEFLEWQKAYYGRTTFENQALLVATVTKDVTPEGTTPQTNSCFGSVYRTGVNESWSAIRTATAGTTVFAGGYLRFAAVGDSPNGNWSDFYRLFASYVTTGLGVPLPDLHNLVVGQYLQTGAGVGIDPNGEAWNTTTQMGLIIVPATPAANNELVTADYDQISYTQLSDIIPRTSASGAMTFTLNANGIGQINLAGTSKFACICTADFNNSEPTVVGAGAEVNFNTQSSLTLRMKFQHFTHGTQKARRIF